MEKSGLVKKLIWMALVAAAVVSAADLNGRWRGEFTDANGRKRAVTFAFRQDGSKLSGAQVQPMIDDAISEGVVNGDTFSFVVDTSWGERKRRTEYHGKAAGDTLVITNQSGSESTFRRISTDAYVEPQPFPKVKLPELRALPDNGLARTPPMGWNSWNHFHRNVNDKVVRETADAMATNGMKAAGYVYVNIDDTWEGTRDAQGNIQTNEKFPNMKALSDYVHSKGLKLGIYSSPGPKTCAGFEGSYAHEEEDARTYAAWGIDYLKYDWCSATKVYQPAEMKAAYQKMAEALRATGRPIVYSLCQYGLQHVSEWGAAVGGNLWRTTGDISDRWESMSNLGFTLQQGLEQYAGPGHWNDPDMLEVGNGGMTDEEYRTHMSLWSILAAPLLAGNDLRSMQPNTLAILTNPEVLAIDQDKAGKQGKRISKDGDAEVWAKPLAGGEWAVGLFNRGQALVAVTAKWSDLGITGSHPVRDLWARADRPASADSYSARVPAHGVVLIRVK